MSEKRAILTMAVGDYWREVATISGPLLGRYAARVGAHLYQTNALPTRYSDNWSAITASCLCRLDLMRDALEEYDRVIWIDADVLVRSDCPDLFDLVPETHWGGLDACPILWRQGKEDIVHQVHNNMVLVCHEDGLPIPDSQGRYFAGGLQVASRGHAHLYAPPVNARDHGWVEESRVNVRMFLAGTQVYYLPEALHQAPWCGPANYWRNSWIIHYVGTPYADRLALMRHDLERWKEMGLWSDT